MNAHRSFLAASLLVTMLLAMPMTGNTAVDPYPNGCVSCHVLDKAKGVDHRLSVALQAWTAGRIEPGLLAQSKASAPAGLTLKGKHPAAEDSLEDIPGACLDCHDVGSKKAPAAATSASGSRMPRVAIPAATAASILLERATPLNASRARIRRRGVCQPMT